MSYDLEVYAPGAAALEKAELVAALQKRGWRIVFLHADAFWQEETWPFLTESGPMEAGDLLLAGWPLKNSLAPRLQALVQERNFGEFKNLAEATLVLTTCSLSLTLPYDGRANYDEEEWRGLEQSSPDYAALMSRSRSYYHLGTSAGRSPFAIEFQHTVSEAIEEVTGGTAENPQGDDLDWEETMGEKPGLVMRFQAALLERRYQRERRRYGL